SSVVCVFAPGHIIGCPVAVVIGSHGGRGCTGGFGALLSRGRLGGVPGAPQYEPAQDCHCDAAHHQQAQARPLGGGGEGRELFAGPHHTNASMSGADRAMRRPPPITQGMPVAPSAASWCRFLRPMIIWPAHTSRPMTPRAMTIHLPQPMILLTGSCIPSGTTGAGSGADASMTAASKADT